MRVAAILLAGGAGRRMRGADKLLEPVAGQPTLRRVAAGALASRAAEVVVVIPDAPARRAALDGLGVIVVEASECAEGMAGSLRAGLRVVADRVDAVVVLLGDMPEIGGAEIDGVIGAFAPEAGRDLCRAVTAAGAPGHPVLIGRRYFAALGALRGDVGARDLLRGAGVVAVPTRGAAAITDLDTPEDWAKWRTRSRTRPDAT